MKCSDCKREMTETIAGGLKLSPPPRPPEPGRIVIGREVVQTVAYVCPRCGKVELRVLSPDWFDQG